MSFASRIAALYASDNLVFGYIPSTQAEVDSFRRPGLPPSLYVVDPNVPALEGVAVRAGWITGSDTDQPRGDEGGISRFSFKDHKAAYGSPGAPHRLGGRNQTMCYQWAERYNPAFIGLASCTDSGFKGPGVKTLMIDLEAGRVSNVGKPQANFEWTSNSIMECIVTSNSGPVSVVANRNPGTAGMGVYGTHTHTNFPTTPGSPSPAPFDTKRYRPDKWVVWTLLCEHGATWSLRYASWSQTHTPGLLIEGTNVSSYVLDDYRNTDARWTKSSAQQAAIDAGDAVELRAAPHNTTRQHRWRLWGQFEDQAEPFLVQDGTGYILNPGHWNTGEATLADEAHYGQAMWSTLAYQAGVNRSDLINWYGDRYTPYMQGKRYGVDPFPDRFGGPATHRISKWFGPIIIANTAISPKFFGDGDDTPPVLPPDVTIPSGLSVVETP